MAYIISQKDARTKIEDEIQRMGPYSHNIVGIILNKVAKTRGDSAAYKLIKELRLDEIWGFGMINSQAKVLPFRQK